MNRGVGEGDHEGADIEVEEGVDGRTGEVLE